MATTTPNYSFILPAVNDPTDQDLWGGYLNENWTSLDTLLGSVGGGTGEIPVGSGMDYWGTAAPSGWVFAYGQALNRTTYATLFVLFGTTYGAGDGSTTFNVPDKRGRASFGKDNMGGTAASRLSGAISGSTLGAAGGTSTHTLTSGEIPSASISVSFQKQFGNATTGTGDILITGNTNQGSGTLSGTLSGGGGAHNNLPPGIVCNYIIYTGV